MSQLVLSIQVTLLKGETNKIQVEITDPVSKTPPQKIDLNDDSDESFAQLTRSLKRSVATLYKVLPHKSKDPNDPKKIQLLEDTIKYQNMILSDPSNYASSDKECTFEFIQGIDETIKKRLLKLIQLNDDTNDSLKTKKGRQAFITAIVEKQLALKSGDDSTRLNVSLGYMDCAKYLGKHKIKADSDPFDVFLTKDNIITDGNIIIPFTINEPDDNPTIPVVSGYDGIWKIYEPAGVVGTAIRSLQGVEGDSMYDIAMNLMKKYKTYETKDATAMKIQQGTCNEKFDVSKSNIIEPYKAQLLELIQNAPPLKENIENVVNKVVNSKEFAVLDKSQIKNYNKEILGEKCTTFLGYHMVDGVDNQPVFLTKDGIITDGFAILPISENGLKDNKIVDPGSGPFGGYMRTLKLANKNKLSINPESKETEYDVAVKELKEKGEYGSGLYKGGNKTSSHRPSKKRSTRRIRK
jgi:hypothetical protein